MILAALYAAEAQLAGGQVANSEIQLISEANADWLLGDCS